LRQGGHHATLEDKVLFHERFQGTVFRLPRLLAHNDRGAFHIGRVERRVRDGRAFAALVEELLGSSITGSIFMKPVDGRQGHRCRRIDALGTGLGELHAEVARRR
jgi:hypothetical protein